MPRPWITEWNPDDEHFWARTGQRIARRNLSFSMFAEFLGFAVWVLWSVTAAKLNDVGFDFDQTQLFTLAALPALVGATARFPYTFAVPRFGGRNWTVVSALLLVVPCVLLAVLVTNPATPYWAFLCAAATAGFGGGNFASSMANISFFYPDARKGAALGLNAAGGNLGVAVAQLVVPLVVTVELFGLRNGGTAGINLANAGLVWIPLILLAAACAWLFMDNLEVSQASFRQQAAVFKRKQTWVMAWLYIGTFGSFIGFSAALPLLLRSEFPHVALSLAFLGPAVGSLSRPLGGWMADRWGGARVTLATFTGMIVAVLAVIAFLGSKAQPYAFAGFVTTFVVLLALTGIGNGSTYRMIPLIFRTLHVEEAGSRAAEAPLALVAAKRESAAACGFIGAIGAYGGWMIPQAYGLSLSMTGGIVGALYAFIGFYVTCVTVTWWYYLRRRVAINSAPSLAHAGV